MFVWGRTVFPEMKQRFFLLLPLVLFIGFVGVALVGLQQDKEGRSANPLVGKAMPSLTLPPLEKDFSAERFKGKVFLINYFASWCLPCRAEHEFLETLSLPVLGVAYKDKPEAARRFLDKEGNPYQGVALDRDGRSGIEWGITGVPETFLIGREGTILAHHAGPLNEAVWGKVFAPHLAAEEK
jgi:cytochrome c biogenesis protein CcmG/thiol:disulfide interchange protein DsbE